MLESVAFELHCCVQLPGCCRSTTSAPVPGTDLTPAYILSWPAWHPGCQDKQEHATKLHMALSRRLGCREMQEELLACIRQAAMLPLTISVTDSPTQGLTQLSVTAPVDSGGGGRPRVLYDVTAGLAKLGAPCEGLGFRV